MGVCLLAGALISCGQQKGKSSSRSPGRVSGADSIASSFLITQPVANSTYTSSDNSFKIEGSCYNGSTIEISGSHKESIRCVNGTFSFQVAKAEDGTYDFTLSQTLGSGDPVSRNFRWKRDASVPPPPSLILPESHPFYTNQSPVVLRGKCSPGLSVRISGLPVPALTCSDKGIFTGFIPLPVDGSFNLSFIQKSPTGVDSEPHVRTWIKDTKPPAAPTIKTANPFQGTYHRMILEGECETGAAVVLKGELLNHSQVCSNGAFQFSLQATRDGTHKMSLSQTDRALNTSPSISFTWIKDTEAPPAPIVLNPTQNPYEGAQNPFLLQGTCLNEHRILYDGVQKGEVLCSNERFVIPFLASQDGVYPLILTQVDPVGNKSISTNFSWRLDTQAPESPLVQSPGEKNHISSDSALSISGKCENGSTILLSGGQSEKTTCQDGAFQFTLKAEEDGTRTYLIRQIDSAGNSSEPSLWSWTRDSSRPESPQIQEPKVLPHLSNSDVLELRGSCLPDSMVNLLQGESVEASTPCAERQFVLTIKRTEDADHKFTLRQTSRTGVDSDGLDFIWTRDTQAPNPPQITLPKSLKAESNEDSLILAGGCDPGMTVLIAGEKQQETPCNDGLYTAMVPASIEGRLVIKVLQRDPAGNPSEAIEVEWNRDLTPPAPVKLVSPASNPYYTGSNALTLTGTCEAASIVMLHSHLTGREVKMDCTKGGSFEFPVSRTEDGRESYALLQFDRAGNKSEPLEFEWTLDQSVPPSPEFLDLPSNPLVSNKNTLALDIACEILRPEPGTVILSGSGIKKQDQVCSDGKVHFDLPPTPDGDFSIQAQLIHPLTGAASALTTMKWMVDTATPEPLKILNPTALEVTTPDSLKILALCEPGSEVSVTGKVGLRELCRDGTFSAELAELPDGSYEFHLQQTDPALNVSRPQKILWHRSSKAPEPPVILTPATQPHIGNTLLLMVTGSCTANAKVELLGPQSDSILCSSRGSFAFTLQGISDGLHKYEIRQTLNGLTSEAAGLAWILDQTPPEVRLSLQPEKETYDPIARFNFEANEEKTTVTCQLDLEEPKPCTSPLELEVAPGEHTLLLIPTDHAGNTGSKLIARWNVFQKRSAVLAQYSFAGDLPYLDSSANRLHLKIGGSKPKSTSGPFESGAIALDGNAALDSPLQVVLDPSKSDFTLEAFFKVDSEMPENTSMVLFSKSDGVERIAFELRYSRGEGEEYTLDLLIGNPEGGYKTFKTDNLGSSSLNTWNYITVGFTGGQARIHFGQKLGEPTAVRGVFEFGDTGLRLLPTESSLIIGNGNTDGEKIFPFTGELDEIRFTSGVRESTTVPTRPF